MLEVSKPTYDRIVDTNEAITRIDFSIYRNLDVIKDSAIDNPAGITVAEINNNGKPVMGGALDERLGVTENNECHTCRETSQRCPGHFGHIALAEPVFHTGFITYLKTILSCICIRCHKLLVHKNEDEIARLIKNKHGKQRFDEIRALVKRVNICNSCGAPAHKIRKENKYSNILLLAEPVKRSGDEAANVKKQDPQVLTPQLCYDILKSVSNEDCMIMGFDPNKSRPEDMVIKNFPVPPVQVRPSIKMEILTSSSIDDDLTHKLIDIIKSNENLKTIKGDGSLTKSSTISDDFTLLQFHVATFFDNRSIGLPRSQQKNKKPTKSLSERLGSKEGRVRGNLMGKRADFSGRTVITSEPNTALNGLGMPLIIAKNLTFPEIVTQFNLKKMEQLVKNGSNIYPGANFVIKNTVDADGNDVRDMIRLKNRKVPIKLELGDIVERHLVDGDIVLFNRQPSLHKLSMMGHLINVIPNEEYLTFRVNVSVTEPYNADYDGDEMNVHVPQSIQTVCELRLIANAGKRLIKQSDSQISMGVKQDTIMGSFQLSHKDKLMKIDWKDAMNILMVTSGKLNGDIPKGKLVSGKHLYSQIIPKGINVERGALKIKNGQILDGTMSKSEIKAVLHKIWFNVGDKESVHFIDDLQRLILQWLLHHGFTVGIKDCVTSTAAYNKINAIIETKRKEVLSMITEYENDPYIMAKYAFEATIVANLQAIQGDIQSVVSSGFTLDGGIHVTVQSGSAGDQTSAANIIGAVGQVIVEGQRMRKGFNNRTLPMFYQYDDSAFARGFTRNSFTSGLDPAEMFFNAVAGREGLIATAIKSVTGDTPVVIIENNKAKQVLIGDWIDAQLDASADQVEHHEERDMELLRLTKKAYIPTADVHGNTSWGEISAITRHDPGKELYQIKTHGGRKVIVTESKSLLIWNAVDKIFERMSTPDVKVGDYVPVTMNLTKPDIINTHIDVSDYLSKYELVPENISLNRNNGVFLGRLLTVDDIIPCMKGYSVSFANLIAKMIGNNNTKFVPNEAFTAPDGFVIGLIDGFCSKNATITDTCIQLTSESPMVVDGINMLLSRFGIFGEVLIAESSVLSIRGQWAAKFADTFSLAHDDKLKQLKTSTRHINFDEQNDVVLDKIIEINKIDVALYPKVYDLTIPSTLNFGLANGLHVVDTADTGYLERKLVKTLEDIKVEYDGTVRNANDKVIQFTYGDNGINTERQIEQKIGLISANDKTVRDVYVYTENEIADMIKRRITTEKYSLSTNEALYKKMIAMRNHLRKIQKMCNTSAIAFKESYMMPVDLNQYIINLLNKEGRVVSQKNIVDPCYVLSEINRIYSTDLSKIMKYINSRVIIKKTDEIRNKFLLKLYLFDVLTPKKCTHVYQLTKIEFDSMTEFFIKMFRLARIEGGEMVGTVAAQSIGEPVTQANLKSFHKAGVGKTVTAELPRIKELLSVTSNIKTPIMKVILNDEYKNDRNIANKISSHLRSISIQNVIDSVDIIYDPNPTKKTGLMAADEVNNIFEVSQSKSGCSNDIQGLPWVIRLVLSKEKMNELNVTMLEIKTSFCKNWSMRHEDSKGSKKEFKKVIEKILQCAIVSNYENSPSPIIHVRFDSSNYGFNTLVQFQQLIISKYIIKGISNITDSSDIQEESYIDFDKDGNVVRKKQFVINTDGVNLSDITQINGINLSETTCNDIVSIYEQYGVNAAKNAFIREFTIAVESSGGGFSNYQHIKLLADTITHMGTLNAVNRHGANKLDTDPFSRASFEKTVEQMLAAAAFGQTDYIRSVSAKIMVGSLINGGTGAFDLLLDHMKVKTHFASEHKASTSTKIVKKSSVISDLIKKKQHK